MANKWQHYRNYLFDFDGTLVDSSSLHEQAFMKVITSEIPSEAKNFEYEKMKGLTTLEVFKQIGINDPRLLKKCVGRKQQNYRDFVQEGRLKLIGNAKEVLEMIISKGKKNYLVTSGSSRSVMVACEILQLQHLFEGFITSDDVRQGKPSPDPYLLCLERNHLDINDCVAVEDATSGVLSAKGAKLPVIGVNNENIASLSDVFFSTISSMVEII